MGVLLNAKDISLSFPTKPIFGSVSLSVDAGDRIGIVGRNGDGKTSLLKLLSGSLAPDAGELVKRSDVTIGILGQSDSLDPDMTVLQAATGGAATYSWASERGSREAMQRLMADIGLDALVGELSGGQRRRVDMARLLISSWDVLMLDEPTNHLDIQTITWLARHLRQRWTPGSGALLVVTHDRWFIDEVCTSMWEVHDRQVRPFEGGYSAYVLERVRRDQAIRAAEEKRQNLMRKELAWLSRGAQARATKPKFHVRSATALIADEPPPRDKLELRRAAVTRLGKQVIEFSKVDAVLGGKPILQACDFLIGPGDRLAILGGNGVGKTTLLRLMVGDLSPTSGLVKVGRSVRMAYLSQQLEELDAHADRRVMEVLDGYKRGYSIDGRVVSSTEMLRRLGFEGAYLLARVNELSGGQKRRLQLLLSLLEEPNVLILDEPGNDFDTDMLVVLEDLLDAWPGTLVLVSHDRYLVERVTDMQYTLSHGQLRHLPGGVDEYLTDAEQELGLERPLDICAPRGSGPIDSPGDAIGSAEAYELRKQLASLERRIGTMQAKAKGQAASLFDIDPTDYIALGEAQAKLQGYQDELLGLEAEWLELSELLEQ
jgi:ATPase subunit of ABC transporter with duplicated ATPase domains